MNADVLDLIASTFLTAIDSGFSVLYHYSLPLLAITGGISFYLRMSAVTASGAGLGEALGDFVWICIRLGAWVWLIVTLPLLLEAALATFVQWGIAPAQGTFSLGDFMLPSRLIRAGWTAAMPILDFIKNMGWGKAAPWNWPTLAIFLFCFMVIFIAFAILAWEVAIALIEWHFAMMVSTVLVPWGVLTQTGFLAEFSFAWLIGGLIRMLIMSGVMGITIQLFAWAKLPEGVDPGISEALIMASVASVFAALAWVIPKRASAIGGRGMALALGASELYGPIMRVAAPVVLHGASQVASQGAARAAAAIRTYRQAA